MKVNTLIYGFSLNICDRIDFSFCTDTTMILDIKKALDEAMVVGTVGSIAKASRIKAA